jgi:hypothetical protein
MTKNIFQRNPPFALRLRPTTESRRGKMERGDGIRKLYAVTEHNLSFKVEPSWTINSNLCVSN